MRISVFGLGYVGAVSCGCLAEVGHELVGVDINAAKVATINRGEAPVSEPGLADCLAAAVRSGRLTATDDPATAVRQSDAAIVCVGTPSGPAGDTVTTQLESVCRQIGDALRDRRAHFTVFVRSTALPPVHARLMRLLEEVSGHRVGGPMLSYVCHPEFIREGNAVHDFHRPAQIVFGISDDGCRPVCDALYPTIDTEAFYVEPAVAALVKYASNCFHALKVTFANEIGLLSREYDVDAREVMELFCEDRKLNISPSYLRPGAPFGGSCLPKDMRAAVETARRVSLDLPMLRGVLESNQRQITKLLERLLVDARCPIGVVGLTFKEGTDDVRESPMVVLVEQLLGKGHPVLIHDSDLSIETLTGANRQFALASIPHLAELLCANLEDVVTHAETLLVAHRLDPQQWGRVLPIEGRRIIDLVGVPSLEDQAGYEGLYWR